MLPASKQLERTGDSFFTSFSVCHYSKFNVECSMLDVQYKSLDDYRHGRESGEHTGSPLHRVIQWFKTMTTNDYIRGVKRQGWEPFPGKLWQRNYYEHIIRNAKELTSVREYIKYNPKGFGCRRKCSGIYPICGRWSLHAIEEYRIRVYNTYKRL